MMKRENLAFAKSFLLLAIPMAMQNAVTNVVSLVDNVMVTRLGTVPIAAVGLANQIYFVFTVIIIGICGGSAAFLTQYLGRRDYKGIKRIVFINTVFALSLALIFSIACFFLPKYIMSFLSGDPAVIKEGVIYLKWMAAGYLISGITLTASNILKNLEYAKIPLYGSLIAFVFNVLADYALIFGKFGFPAMGVKGAAIATVLSRIIEAAFILIYSFKKIDYLRKRPSEYTEGAAASVPAYLRNALPVTMNETLWSVGSAMLSVIYARISTEAIAAVNISGIIYNLLFVLNMGMAHAAGVVVGKEIGMGNNKAAYEKGTKMSAITVMVSFAMIMIALFIFPYVIKIFSPEPEVARMVKNLVYITMGITPFYAYNLVNICGTLRTGGDVMFCMIIDPGTEWLIGIPLAALCVFWLKLPIEWTYLIAHIESIVKLIIIYIRKRKTDWIKRVV